MAIGDQKMSEIERRRRNKRVRTAPAQKRIPTDTDDGGFLHMRGAGAKSDITDPDLITNQATLAAMTPDQKRQQRAIARVQERGGDQQDRQNAIAAAERGQPIGTRRLTAQEGLAAGLDLPSQFTQPGGDVPAGVEEVTELGGRPRGELTDQEIFRGLGDDNEIAFADRANIATLAGGRTAPLPRNADTLAVNQGSVSPTRGRFGRTAAEQSTIDQTVAGIDAQTAALRGQREAQERGGDTSTPQERQIQDLERQANQRISLRQGLSGFLNQARQANQARRSLRDLRSSQKEERKEARAAAREDARDRRKTDLELIKLGRQGTQAAQDRINKVTDATFDKDVQEVGLQKASENLVITQAAAGIELDGSDTRIATGFQQIKDKISTRIDEEAAGWPVVTALLDVFRGTESATSSGERGRLDFGNMQLKTDGGEKFVVVKGDADRGTRDTRVPLSDFDDDPAFRDTVERLLGGSRGG